MKTTLRAFSLVFVILAPVFLIATNARLALTSHALYEYALDRYDAMAHTGLPREELLKGTRGIIAYFNNDKDYLDITVGVPGQQIPLFNEREVSHMRDVKGLVRGLFVVQAVTTSLAFAYLAYALLGHALGHRWALAYFRRALGAGGAGVALLVLLVGGIAAAGGFQALFIQFHLLSFSNLNWILDPTRDRLLQMFPEPFWFDATALIAGLTLVWGLLMVMAALLLERRARQTPATDA